MSHQTGIRANDELKVWFARCKDGKTRLLKIVIEDEQMKFSVQKPVEQSWEADMEKMVPSLVDDSKPCYILLRQDTRNNMSGAYDWMLISWSPDDSNIRQKMLYASTKATLKQEFGSAFITQELHASSKSDVTSEGLARWRYAAEIPAPLTRQEEELAELNQMQRLCLSSSDRRCVTPVMPVANLKPSGVALPLTEQLAKSLAKLKKGKVNYVQMKIDTEKEEIQFVGEANIPVEKLSQQMPATEPRYHLYNFAHKFDGSSTQSLIFIYSMASGEGVKTSMKDRMMYASCKGPLSESIEHNHALPIDKKLEIDATDELTGKSLYNEVHPPKVLEKPKFDKPKGPPSRGAKRLTKI